MRRKVVTPSTSTRKRRLKSSFRYLTMKQLEKSREYKGLQKIDKADRRNDKKPWGGALFPNIRNHVS
jgi:hypothetical protein